MAACWFASVAPAIAALALVACGGQEQGLQVVASTPLASRPTAAAVSPTPAQVKVYVTGAVVRPGVYSLPLDSRVEDAVRAAGGFMEGADMPRINLAARVRDEQEIFVPRVGESTSPPGSVAQVNVNRASAAQLRDALGISASLANKIVSYRNRHGAFRSVEDLRNVPVPDDQLARFREAVSVQ